MGDMAFFSKIVDIGVADSQTAKSETRRERTKTHVLRKYDGKTLSMAPVAAPKVTAFAAPKVAAIAGPKVMASAASFGHTYPMSRGFAPSPPPPPMGSVPRGISSKEFFHVPNSIFSDVYDFVRNIANLLVDEKKSVINPKDCDGVVTVVLDGVNTTFKCLENKTGGKDDYQRVFINKETLKAAIELFGQLLHSCQNSNGTVTIPLAWENVTTVCNLHSALQTVMIRKAYSRS